MRPFLKDPRIWMLLAIAAAIGVSLGAGSFNRYYMGIAIDVGINIILAVSLNLINGHTGQFSLGHAGFMAVGGYIAAKITLLYGGALFFPALLVGGVIAAIAGLAVGGPS
ncbi:MAG: branched-chain amino acid ABC transporter permease, partial [Chthoniobacteraceae bacterium]